MRIFLLALGMVVFAHYALAAESPKPVTVPQQLPDPTYRCVAKNARGAQWAARHQYKNYAERNALAACESSGSWRCKLVGCDDAW